MDSTKPVRVNVGTIGHVDHGRTTLITALGRVLGEIVAVDGIEVVEMEERRQELEALSEIKIGPHRCERSWSKRRKKARKARLAELQRKAFLKEPRPNGQ